MKNPEIEQLLNRYREGTLSESELAELNRLVGREASMADACRRADGIIRRRKATLFTLTGLLVAGAAVWTLLGTQPSGAPLVAEAIVPEVVLPDAPEPVIEQVAQVTPAERKPVVRTQSRSTAMRQAAPAVDEPVVVCNNQCEADSVISDIWKFLTV